MFNLDLYIENAEYLSVSQFQTIFDKMWYKMNYNFRKLEVLQYYNEGNQSPYKSWQIQNINDFCERINKYAKEEQFAYNYAKEKGCSLNRLHLIKFPISQYIQYEYYSYYASSFLDEEIKYLNFDQISEKKLYDFTIFDTNYAFINDYNKKGNLKGAYFINNDQFIKEMILYYDNLFLTYAQDFKLIMKPDEKVISKLYSLLKNTIS